MIKLGESIWNPLDLSEWLQLKPIGFTYLLDGMIPAESLIIVSGRPKLSKKTFLTLAMALAAASGKNVGPFIPIDRTGIPVLFLEAEGAMTFLQERIWALGNAYNIDVGALQKFRMSHRHPILLSEPDWVAKVKTYVKANAIQLVVVDPMANFMKGNENDVEAIQGLFRGFQEIMSCGASIILLHHTGKPSKDGAHDIDHDMRGSSAIPGAYDVHLALRLRRDTQEHIDLTVRSKNEEDRLYQVKWYFDKAKGTAKFSMLQTDRSGAASQLKQDILAEMMPTFDYTKAKLQEKFGASWEEIDNVLAELVAEGIVEKTGRGYQIVDTSVKSQ